jgi:NADH:ubiquinone oxidoreductase subunit B-like Fe-S oxidoreductase
VGKIIPVDVFIPGCAARPEAIIDGVVLGLKLWKRRAFSPNAPVPALDREVRG